MAMSLNQIGPFSGTPVTPDSVIPTTATDPTTTTTSVTAVWRPPPSNLRVSIKPSTTEMDTTRLSPSPPSSPVSIACQALMTDADVAVAGPVTEHRLLESTHEKSGKGVPVYVMMPLDSVTMSNGVNRRKAMNASLKALKSAGVEGIMMDVWWGLVEREAPGEYNWGGYSELLEMAKKNGLKVQAVMSFHQCGGNVGDSCTIPLPKWVLEEINNDPDLAYTDQWGRRNNEYLSLGCDTIPCLKGRTPIQCYSDYMRAFRDKFGHLLGDTIVEIQVGMGPAGELRYPSYPEKDGVWRFPGIGAFQCYDKYMLSSLQAAAESYGKPEWGSTGPTDAGEYNNWPEDTNFFKKEGGGWNSEYGDFFLSWYSQMLLDHGERILSSATSIFENRGVKISVKVAGIHWHYGTRSHAPELTAGYYNTRFRDGYLPIARMLARHGAIFNFTCIEMRDHEQPQDAQCAPEKLVQQVTAATQEAQVALAGENALPRYDDYAHEQILKAASLSDNDEMCAFTYLRMNPELFQPDNWRKFVGFVKKMKEGKDVHKCWEQVEREAEHFVHITEPLVQEAAVDHRRRVSNFFPCLEASKFWIVLNWTCRKRGNIGKTEVDAAGCQTVILSESFLREIYDGQLFVKVNKGYDFPAMDPWGTSDPYVVLQLDSQIVKSNIKWGTKEPTWNEELTLYIKLPPTNDLQIAAWDANLVTPHKRMGNSSVSLEPICDGNSHEVLVELEGMGGGGKVQLEVRYKSFETIEEEKNWWRLPFIGEFLRNNDFESTLRKLVGSQPVQARQFVEYAFGQLKSINDAYIQKDGSSNGDDCDSEDSKMNSESQSDTLQTDSFPEKDVNSQSDKDFWKNFGDTVNQNIVKRLGLPAPENIKWEGFDLLSTIGLHSQTIAEAGYIESGLATPSGQDAVKDKETTDNTSAISTIQSSLPDIKKATQDLLKQTDSIFGALMVLNATVTELAKDGSILVMGDDTKADVTEENDSESSISKTVLDEKKAEEMRTLFSTAESAMEAWAMLATSLGHPSFIKSEFEKICFLDNPETDTQVAIWRDSFRKRLVVAFRGTEQVRWKDLRTDLMLAPTGLNPERIGGDFKEEIQVHSGFLSAYDSVRTRLLSLIKTATASQDGDADPVSKWHVFVTGHSLGGALATLLALELSSSQLAKRGAISVTMYNFGSPRVGNKLFAQVYNEKVKDSWRVVNHRDIIPSVPRLMGYCHVAQPIYLAAGDVENALENIELLGDGYEGDVIGESTPDDLVNEFMKGEKELIEKILNTEINIFRAIRDGTALMQHMEDFYYVSLLEHVRSNYRTIGKPKPIDDGSSSFKEA